MFGKKKKKTEEVQSAEMYSMAEAISVNEYSTSNYDYDKFKLSSGNFKPLFLIGKLDKKQQYTIGALITLIGLIGSASYHYIYSDNDKKINNQLSFVEEINLNLTQKNFYLKNISLFDDVNKVIEGVGTRKDILEIEEKLSQALNQLNLTTEKDSDVFNLFGSLNKLQDNYKIIERNINAYFSIEDRVLKNKKSLMDFREAVQTFYNNYTSYGEKKARLLDVLLETNNLIVLYEERQNALAVTNKNKQIDALIKNFNRVNEHNEWINSETAKINNLFNLYLTEYSKLDITKNNLKYESLLNPVLTNLEKVKQTLKNKSVTNIDNLNMLYIFLFIFLIGFALLLIIRMKFYEYEKEATVKVFNDVMNNVDDIVENIDINIKDKSHKITGNKSKRLSHLIEAINMMWDKSRQTSNNIYSNLGKIKKTQDFNDDFVQDLTKINKDILSKNNLNVEDVDKINKLILKNNEYIELYSSNILNLSKKDKEVDDYLVDTLRTFNDLYEENKAILDKTIALIKVGDDLKSIALKTKFLSEDAKILAFNADLIAQKTNVGNQAFTEVSKRISHVSDDYQEVSEQINFITENVIKNFDFIKTNLNKMDVQIGKSRANADLLHKKASNLKNTEIKIKEEQEKMHSAFKDFDVVELKSNVQSINDMVNEVNKKVDAYHFNASVNKDGIKEIAKMSLIEKKSKKEKNDGEKEGENK